MKAVSSGRFAYEPRQRHPAPQFGDPLFRHFYAAYPVRSTLMLLSITVAALAEGVGIAALLPLINLVITPEGSWIRGYHGQSDALR